MTATVFTSVGGARIAAVDCVFALRNTRHDERVAPRCWVWLAASVLLTACGEPAVPPEPDRDLVGPTIELSADQLTEPTPLGVVEGFRYGLGDQYPFSNVTDIAVAGAHVWILDPLNAELVQLDSAGHLVRVVGRRGQGPGEFTAPDRVAASDDTVFVLDRSHLHAFSHMGDVLYSQRLEPLTHERRLVALQDIAWVEGNLMGWSRTAAPVDLAEGVPFTDSIVVYGRSPESGQFHDEVLRLKGVTGQRLGDMFFMTLFGGVGAVDAAHSGPLIYAEGTDYRMDVYDSDGDFIKHMVATIPRKEVDARSRERLIDRALGKDEHDSYMETPREDYEAAPSAPFRAVLGRVIAGDDGRVLVERMDVSAEHPLQWADRESTWDLVDLDGAVHGRVTLPAGFKPLAFHQGSLYGAEAAGLVPTVVRYDITSLPAARP